ncbi:MAG TPA: hypothetical protein PKG95_15495 [Anaerolineaceae bacterium]|nr:hypothetical protein [Anaerolineaceae bacterium]
MKERRRSAPILVIDLNHDGLGCFTGLSPLWRSNHFQQLDWKIFVFCDGGAHFFVVV